ncbi:putative membrane protein [Phytophthora megakarya]|uniref:Putative membrane protein n=1 Tax=Phytophthora megakarya TaxID=4795 RepID=A0A225X4Y3_9STRA|nr:putative membrane protein [Phytophthora megakarya]
MNPTLRYAYSRNGDQGRVDEKCLVRVQIPTVDSTDGGKVRYHVRVTNIRSGQVWEVPRRFSEFLTLRNELIDFFAKTDKKCPGCRNYEKVLKLFEFPRKHVFTSVTPVVINYRKKALRNFVALLASHTFTTTPKCPTCSGFPFTGVRDWLMTAEAESAVSVAADGSPTNEIRDTLDVKDFTNYHPVSNAMPVDQEGRFVGSTVPKYTPPIASPTKHTDNSHERRSPPRHKAKQFEDSKSQLRYNDGDSSISSISDPPSPPSVDEFVMPVPAPAHMKEEDFENDIEGEDDEEFSSFVASSTSSNASERKNEDQPASEPPASDDSASRMKTVEKKNFKFARSSIGADSERSSVDPRESSMIDIDGLDDDEDEGLNMDFMNSVHVANGACK